LLFKLEGLLSAKETNDKELRQRLASEVETLQKEWYNSSA
jgi:hypothetical protein